MIFDQDGQPLHETRRKGRPRLGKIRLGTRKQSKSGSGYPDNTPFFRIDPEESGRLNTYLMKYARGDAANLKQDWQKKQYEGLKADADKAIANLQKAVPDEFWGDVPELLVWLAYEDPARTVDYAYRLRSGGGLQCSCDGRIAHVLVDRDANRWEEKECEYSDGRMACEELTGGRCKMEMSIYVELPWLGTYETADGTRRDGTMGIWQVESKSWAVLGALFDEMDRIRAQYGRLTCVPVRLFKVEEPTRYKDKDGKWKDGKAYIVHMGPWGSTPQASLEGITLAPTPLVASVKRVVVEPDPDDVPEELTPNGVPVEGDPEDDMGDGDNEPQPLTPKVKPDQEGWQW